MKKTHSLTSLSLRLPACVLAAGMTFGLAACGEDASVTATPGATTGAEYTEVDRPEPGLQGQIPLANQQSGDSALGYRKGLKLIGQNTIMDRGANFSMAWIDDCAYVTTTSPGQIFGPLASP